MSAGDTIIALASGAGQAGVAVLRASGPQAGALLSTLTGRALPPPRHASLRWLRDPAGAFLDQALVTWFPAPASFTGEDVVELGVHGGRATIAAVLRSACVVPDVRMAEPGEFTRRAFANGRLDLTAAEGLADLVAAETEGQRQAALAQYAGGLTTILEEWRADLIALAAQIEAAIDFPDEDLPFGLSEQVRRGAAALRERMAAQLAESGRRSAVRDGVSVVILGPPNAGKSSLLNYLAGRDAAIVTARAGTTRDVLEVRLDLQGLPVLLSDTAGLRAATDDIEAEGVRRALARGAAAHLRLALLPAALWPEHPAELEPYRADQDTIWLLSRADEQPDLAPPGFPRISLVTGEGLAGLGDTLAKAVADRFLPALSPGLNRERHRALVESAMAALAAASRADLPELAAENLRLAAVAIGRLTGRIDVEDVLDRVFSDFCIGK